MMTKYIYLLIVFVFVSCNVNREYDNCTTFTNEQLSKSTFDLVGKTIDFDVPVRKPVKIYSFDSILIVNNMAMDTLIDVYNLNANKYICSNIPAGSGPEELLILSNIQERDSFISFYDQMKNKIFTYRKCDLLQNSPKVIKVTQLEEPANNAFITPCNNIIATSFNTENKRFSLFDLSGKFMQYIGDYPNYKASLSNYEAIESFICHMAVKDTIVVLAYNRTDLLEIYDSNGILKRRIQGPDHFFPAIKQIEEGEKVHFQESIGKSRDAYFSPVIYKNEIWVLFSGKYFDPYHSSSNYLNNIILVFDIEGNIKRKYILSEPIISFTINSDRNILYGISDVPEMHITEFELNHTEQS